jgi:hypothetical protein
MLASLTLISLLQAPTVGADGLSIANARFTHGALGPVRTSAEVIPGDSLVVSFEIHGIGADDAGKASYTTAVEVADSQGKVLFNQPARKFQEFMPLGGSTLPAMAQIDLGQESPAGTYTIKVTVTDNNANKSASMSKQFTVGKKRFDVVRFAFTGDPDAQVPVGAFAAGQPLWFHGTVVGFQRAADGKKQPNVTLTLRLLDESGKPIGGKPFTGTIDKDVLAEATGLPVRFFVPLNRAGTYTLEVSAEDGLKKGSSAVHKFPLVVLPTK